MLSDLGHNKEASDKAKMEELQRKIALLEKASKDKEGLEKERQRLEQMKENAKMAKNKHFLENIKSYTIEDI